MTWQLTGSGKVGKEGVPVRMDLWKGFISPGWLRTMEEEVPERMPRFVASLERVRDTEPRMDGARGWLGWEM